MVNLRHVTQTLYHEVGHIVHHLTPWSIVSDEEISVMFEYAYQLSPQINDISKKLLKYLKNKGIEYHG